VAVGLAPSAWLAFVVLPLLGAATIAFAITGNSTLQLTAADAMRGRVMALYSVVFLGSTPLGGPLAGLVGETIGPRVGLVGGGAIAIGAGLIGLTALARASSSQGRPVVV
jgi:MFS family permease